MVTWCGWMSVVCENALPGGKWRGHPARARSQPVVNQRLIKSEVRGRPQSKSEIYTFRASQKRLKRHQRLRRKKILSDSLCIPRGEGDPFVRLRRHQE